MVRLCAQRLAIVNDCEQADESRPIREQADDLANS
jgi:hypothetical protein